MNKKVSLENVKTNKLLAIGKRIMMKTKVNSPKLLLVGGSLCLGAGIFLACKNTLKLEKILNEHDDNINEINEQSDEIVNIKKEKTKVYMHTCYNLAKNYAIPFTMVSGGMACIFMSNHILDSRNKETVAALGTVASAFSAYRDRVKKELGEEKEELIYRGYEEYSEKEKVKDADGKTKTITNKKYKKVTDNPFTFFYDASCASHTGDPVYDYMHLRSVESYWTQQLHLNGYVYLREIGEDLGVDEGTVNHEIWNNFGWIDDESFGDNFIDLGIDTRGSMNHRFITGEEDTCILCFNCNGYISDKVGDIGVRPSTRHK